MKRFIVRYLNNKKSEHTYVEAERFKRTDELYIFLDGDGNTVGQYETRNVIGVDDLGEIKSE